MTDYYDAFETRDPAQREREQFAALPRQLAHARANSAYYSNCLRDIALDAVTSRDALAGLPVTRKSDLAALQQSAPPFGGLAALPMTDFARVFASPGSVFEPEARRADYWRCARALFAAGFRRGELIHNTFSYHFTPAGSMIETAAQAIGCPVFPAGGGQSELQVAAIAHLRPVAYAGTPSFLRIIVETSQKLGVNISSMRKALVSGEALSATVRDELGESGIVVLQCYASADLGLIAYESAAREGLIVDEGIILELVTPGTGDPVAEGEVGEVVVTTFNPQYPLVRFATGDLSAFLPGRSPCGRTAVRIKGWMGRADQTTKVRGMFIHPSMIADLVRRHPQVARARLVVSNPVQSDRMLLRCETESQEESLRESIQSSIREVTRLRGEVELVPPGVLPTDGKVIDDRRTYD